MNYKNKDAVELIPGAKFVNGTPIPANHFGKKLFVREMRPNGDCVLTSSLTASRAIGTVSSSNLIPYTEGEVHNFTSYIVYTLDNIDAYPEPIATGKVKTKILKDRLFTIIEEKDGWGRLINNMGWIKLENTKKIQ